MNKENKQFMCVYLFKRFYTCIDSTFFFFFLAMQFAGERTQATVVIQPSPNPWATRELGKQRIQIVINKSREKKNRKERQMENIKW